MNLSKSKYITGLQCPKILWMDKHMPEQQTEQNDTRMIVGSRVGDVAMGYFGAYTEVPFDWGDMDGMITETKCLLNAGTEVIAEAAFSYDGSYCIVDLLRKAKGGYELIEVKSATGRADEDFSTVDWLYLDELAYQYYILTKNGLNIKKISLMRLNSEYVRCGELDLQQLFVITDCTEPVLEIRDVVLENIAELKNFITSKDEPDCQIGSYCKGCAYQVWCFRNLPAHNVFDIGWRMRGSKKDAAYQDGHITFQDILDSSISLNEQQLLQVKTVVHDLPPHVDRDNIQQFLDSLSYPLYHLDFETYQQAIPLFDGVWPYLQLPFQYSIHIQETPHAEPTHREFLGKEGVDSRRELAERLCADIPESACVLAYYASFERGRIRELAALFPDLEKHLMRIHDNILDLADPFSKGHYYRREMGGSFSIKAVLPALCGDDPELDYKKLDLIQNGGDAMNAFATLHEQSPEDIARIRKALLAYCKLDTLAMVRVLDKLYEAVGKPTVKSKNWYGIFKRKG